MAHCSNDTRHLTKLPPIPRGSQETFEIEWGDGDGGAADLTGYALEVYLPSPELPANAVTASFISAATGRVKVLIDDAAGSIPPNIPLSFRIRLRPTVVGLPYKATFKIEMSLQ